MADISTDDLIAQHQAAGPSTDELIASHKDDHGFVADNLASAGRVASGVWNMVRHPIDTAEGMFGVTKGIASKGMRASGLTDAIAGAGQTPEGASLDRDIEKQKAGFREKTLDAAVDQKVKQWSNPTHNIPEDMLDLSAVLSPMRALPGTAGRVAGAVSDATNLPGQAINATGKALKPAADYARSAARTDPSAFAKRQAQSQEFGVPLSQGQISEDAGLLSKEDNLRYARDGQAPKVMQSFDDRQAAAIDDATDRLRAGLTGAPAAVPEHEIGQTLTDTYKSAARTAKNNVTNLYDKAFDPAELQKAGIAQDIPIESVYGLKNKIEDSFLHEDRPGGVLVPTAPTAPNTTAALKLLDQFSENGGVGSSFNKMTQPPQAPGAPGPQVAVGIPGRVTPQAPERPLVTGVNYQQMDLVRKMLNGLRKGAANNPTDLAGMRRVLDVFDEELGKRNPLLNDARQAHMDRVTTFDPQRVNAQGVNPILKSLANDNNPGQLIYNKLFNGTALKNGEAGPILDSLSGIMGKNPAAVQAIKEGMLNRLLTKNGAPLSPKKAGVAIQQALEGPSGQVYQKLFTPDELAKVQRYGDLLDHVGTTRAAQNASKTSYNFPWLKKATGAGLGGAAGAALGHATGVPLAGEAGMAAGGALGAGLDNFLAFARARKLSAGDLYSAPSVSPKVAAGAAGAADVLTTLSPGMRALARLSSLTGQ